MRTLGIWMIVFGVLGLALPHFGYDLRWFEALGEHRDLVAIVLLVAGVVLGVLGRRRRSSTTSLPSSMNRGSTSEDQIRCPKCGSTQISAQKVGFGLGKAAAGGLILGPIGLLGGAAGSGKVKITCLKCGHEWKPGSH